MPHADNRNYVHFGHAHTRAKLPTSSEKATQVRLAARRTLEAARACGLNARQAAELVAATMAAGVAAAESPLARAAIQIECETVTRSLVMAVRARSGSRVRVAA